MPDRKKAVALAYDQASDNAPKVLAKGEGKIAQQIIEKAKEHGINVFENRELAQALLNLELQETIPSELYQAVAEVFAWLASIEAKKRKD